MSDWEDPRRVLARHGLSPKRSFSQNFLVSRHAVEAIVAALAPQPHERIVELGPGLGTLTGALLGTGAALTAIEKDREMIEVLRSDQASARLTVLEGDAAAVDLAALAGGDRIILAGNLPYAVTGAILRNLCAYADHLSRAAIMVQREVRDRLLAHPDTSQYGALTVFVQARFEVKSVLKVPAGAFFPPPKVESAVVMLIPRNPPLAEETVAFRDVVRAAFQARRKTLKNALTQVFGTERSVAALAHAAIDGTRRGETLSIAELARVAEAIERSASRQRDPS